MKIDVVIGNPPYQESINKNSLIAIYHKFMKLDFDLSNTSCMIVPARWISDNPNGISKQELIELRKLNNFKELVIREDEVFINANIAGGVCYFLYDKNNKEEINLTYINKEGYIEKTNDNIIINGYIIKNSVVRQIIRKVKQIEGENYTQNNSFKQIILGSRAFTGNDIQLNTNWNQYKLERDRNYYIRYYNKKTEKAFVCENDVTASIELVPLRKIYLHLTGPVNKDIISKPFIGEKNSVCSRSFTVLNILDDNEEKLQIYLKYIKTKWFRFLVSAIKNTQHANKDVYTFVPLLTDDEENGNIEINDKYFYRKYNLSNEEIAYIENNINDM